MCTCFGWDQILCVRGKTLYIKGLQLATTQTYLLHYYSIHYSNDLGMYGTLTNLYFQDLTQTESSCLYNLFIDLENDKSSSVTIDTDLNYILSDQNLLL